MNWYYFTTEAGLTSEEAAFIESTTRLDSVTEDELYQEAQREFDFIRERLEELGIPYEVAEEDCYNGDIFILGSTGKPLTELRQ